MKMICLSLNFLNCTILNLNKRKENKNWIDLAPICYIVLAVENNSYFNEYTE